MERAYTYVCDGLIVIRVSGVGVFGGEKEVCGECTRVSDLCLAVEYVLCQS